MVLSSLVSTVMTIGKSAALFASENSNALLTGVALTSLTTTTFSLISAIPKVMNEFEKRDEDLEIARNDRERKQIERGARIKVAKLVVIPVLMFLLCATSIISNAYINSHKMAALATAYALSEQKVDDLEKAAKNIAGPKKASLIDEQAAGDDIERRGSKNEEDVIETGHGNDLFWEPMTGHWLRANNDFINLAFTNIDNIVRGDSYTQGETQRLNDLFERLKLPENTELGQWFGWRPTGAGESIIGCTLTETGKHLWSNGKSEYYTVINYSAKYLGKVGQTV